MIKSKIKNARGISLISLSITVVVLVILSNIVIRNIGGNLRVEKLKEMQNDISNLRDKVSSYYAQNGQIPMKMQYNNINHMQEAGIISNVVDTGAFYVLDLSAFENLTLNRGQDFEKIKDATELTEEQAKKYTDLYIINETSHNIFYVAGITIDNDTYYTDYASDEIDQAFVSLRYMDNVKIPEGFYYVGGSKEEGLVISDVPGDDLENSKHGNQFVWVPVEKIEDFHTVEGYTSGELQNKLEKCAEPYTNGYATEVEEYVTMRKSVEANKGFYIGRFEAGRDADENVIVQKGANVYNNVSWGNSMTDATGGAVEKAKKFAKENNSVTSTLCYGVQWDEALKFIDPSYTDFAKDSSRQGWYSDNYNSTETGNTETNLNRITGLDLIYSDKLDVIANKQKNIYDMAGSVWEWTMEEVSNNTDRVVRGGDNGREGNKNPASYRGNFPTEFKDVYLGFRITLYLNENEEENWSLVYDKKGTYKDKNGDTAYVPQGFQVSRKNGENTIDDGLVVRDSNKNEFVWVPVDNIGNFKRVAGYYQGSQQAYDLANYTEPFVNGYSTEQEEYKAMRQSVKDNNGFYIGRYEAGKDSSGNVVVKKGADVYNNVPWGNAMNDIEGTSNTGGKVGAVKLSRDFATNNSYQGVTSTLCYGVQWDATLKFVDPGFTGFAKDSSRQGWYSDNYNSKETGNTETNPNHTTGVDLIYSNKPNVIANKQKNIYDMAGNVCDWTMEAYNTSRRVFRGGDYYCGGSGYPASIRNFNYPTISCDNLGFRLALYVNENEEENWSLAYDQKGTYIDKNGDTANIPQGFQVSRKNGENTIDDGLVVRDSNKNEFVWVPVNDINNFKRVAGYFGESQQSYDLTKCAEPFTNGYSTEEAEYKAMKKSVEDNHGFYIGRYEAGKDGSGNVVVKKGADFYNIVPWGNAMNDIEGTSNTGGKVGAVKLARDFATNNRYQGVTSTLCYGVQWDTTLKFIDPNYTGFAKDSSKQGWHSDNYNSKETGNTETNPNHTTGVDLIYSNKPNVIANKQRNIYDMAGNAWEWTMEAYDTNSRIYRGGGYNLDGSTYPASNRNAGNPASIYDSIDFRLALYL